MGYMSIYAAKTAIEAVGNAMKSEGMTEEEIDEATWRFVVKLVTLVIIALSIIMLVYVLFNGEQFCIAHDIKQFFTEPGEYLKHNFSWLVK